LRIPLSDAAKGAWSIEGFAPALAAHVRDDLDSVFQVCDVDKDGNITKQELSVVLGGNKFVESLDTSGDGLISHEEFLQFGRGVLRDRGARAIAGYTKAMMKKCDKLILRRVVWRKLSEAIFVGLDRDNSGTMEREEIQHFDKRGKFFAKLDADKDGGVSIEEFVQYVLTMESARDANAVENFLSHVRNQCEARIAPPEDDLMSKMTVINRADFIEQYKHASTA